MKSRHHQTEDVSDENGQWINGCKKAVKCWRDYFEKVSTNEFLHPPIASAPPVFSPVQPIAVDKVVKVEKRVKLGKATAPKDLVEVWISQCRYSVKG